MVVVVNEPRIFASDRQVFPCHDNYVAAFMMLFEGADISIFSSGNIAMESCKQHVGADSVEIIIVAQGDIAF